MYFGTLFLMYIVTSREGRVSRNGGTVVTFPQSAEVTSREGRVSRNL